MTKVENLTQAERQELKDFIGTCVLDGVKFPSNTIGMNNVTIQELTTERTITSLENYGEMIEKLNSKEGSSFKTKRGPLKFNGVLATDLIKALHLIIKFKEYEAYKAKVAKKKAELKTFIEDTKSPEERRNDALAELKELEAVEVSA